MKTEWKNEPLVLNNKIFQFILKIVLSRDKTSSTRKKIFLKHDNILWSYISEVQNSLSIFLSDFSSQGLD